MTAQQLARELEVSERTIYRDMNVLSSARFPVYANSGIDGGYPLLPGYQPDLSDLNPRDIRALAALTIPDSLDQIGIGSGLRTALHKLLKALGEAPQLEEQWMKKRFLMDTKAPNIEGQSTLPLLQSAVWEDRMITCQIRYPFQFGLSAPLQLAPYTLVAADRHWFIIGARMGFTRIYPLSAFTNIETLEEHFSRPADYDPKTTWLGWQSTRSQQRQGYPVLAQIESQTVPWLPHLVSATFELMKNQDLESTTWRHTRLIFDNFHQARMELLGLGGAVRVIAPEALRLSIIDFAQQFLQQNPHNASFSAAPVK